MILALVTCHFFPRIFHQHYFHCRLAWHLSWCLRIIVAFLHFIVASSENRGRGRAWPATAAASPPEFASRGQVRGGEQGRVVFMGRAHTLFAKVENTETV